MSITDELREWAKAFTHWWYDPVKDEYTYTTGTMPPLIDAIRLDSNIIAIADRIDAEHERLMQEQPFTIDMVPMTDESMAEHGWVRLPKDADGVPIRVGDVMEWPTTGETFEVVGIGEGTLFYVEDGSECADWTGASTKRHHHAPTVEDVLCDLLNEYRENECTLEEARLSEYAAKLRLAEED